MNVLYEMTSKERTSADAQTENNQHNARAETNGVGMVTGMPRQNWLGEVVANVTDRVKKWEDWEKSPALRRSEELLRPGGNNGNGATPNVGTKTLEKKTGT